MSSIISPIATTPAVPNDATSQASTAAAMASTSALGTEDTFLQLLVAQIKNQDPTQPTDSSTFLTQLAQFSQLEQLIGIRQDVQTLVPAAATTNTTPAGARSGS
jgi:flagellar basal-body rod modification protein FlgD